MGIVKGGGGVAKRAVLNENVQALFDGERGIEDDESEAEREHIVGVSGLEEVANGTLFVLVKIWILTIPRPGGPLIQLGVGKTEITYKALSLFPIDCSLGGHWGVRYEDGCTKGA